MPKPSLPPHLAGTLLLLILAGLGGCNNSGDKIPFPAEETELPQPKSSPFKFGEAIPIQWKVIPSDSIAPLKVKSKFDLNKLPSKPFDIGGPSPLLKPLEEKPFDLNSFPAEPFDVSKLPSEKLQFKTTLLTAPKRKKAGELLPRASASRGIQDAGSGLGLEGNGRCFLQESNGLLWIGTDRGLVRYDGTNIEMYGGSQGLSNVDIYTLYHDRKGNLWIGCRGGEVFVLDHKAGTIKKLITSFRGDYTYGVTEDQEGRIWIVQNLLGIIIVDPVKNVISKFSSEEGLPNQVTIRVLMDKDGAVWITTFNGMVMVDLKNKKRRIIKFANDANAQAFVGVLQDNAGRLWLSGNQGVYILSPDKKSYKIFGPDQGGPLRAPGLFQARNGVMWMGTEFGNLFSLDLKQNLVEKITVTPSAGNILYSIYQDVSGQLWLGTTKGGCFLFDPDGIRAGNFTTSHGLSSNAVWNVLEAMDGMMWLGTTNGIDIYDQKLKSVKHLGPEQGLTRRAIQLDEANDGDIWVSGEPGTTYIVNTKAGTISTISAAQGLSPKDEGSVMMDGINGEKWFVTGRGAVIVIEPGKSFKQIANLPSNWKGNYANTIFKDSKGQLWICVTGGGFIVVDADQKTFRAANTNTGFPNNTPTAVLEDEAHNMWVASDVGIEIINAAQTEITSLGTPEGLPSDGVFTLNERAGQIYAGTSSGLSVISPPTPVRKTWLFSNYGRAQGLQALDFLEGSTMFSKSGQFWGGVEELDLLILNPPGPDSATSVPSITGINFFDKQHEFLNRNISPQQLRTIDSLAKLSKLPRDEYLNQNKIMWDSVETAYHLPMNLRLPYNQNYLSFTFASATFKNPDKVRYRYILEGIDKNWSPISESSNSENYRDLVPGKYRFKVVGKGMNGIWSRPAIFSFTIMPPWWKAWWAYVLYVLIFIGVIRAVILYRSRTLQRQNQVLEDKVVSRTNALQKSLNDLQETQKQLIQSEKMASLGELTAGIAHEIQNPLNFVNNFSEVNRELIAELNQEIDKGNFGEVKFLAKDITDNEEKINFHGRRAEGIVKSMLQHSRTSNNKKEDTDINALADEYLRLAYHGLRAKDKSFNASMKTDFDPLLGKISVIPQDLGRVILNLITNAFHAVSDKKLKSVAGDGYEPTVTVSTKRTGDKVEIRVSDNGNGIPQAIIDKVFQPFFTTKPAGQGTGLGLSMSYDIVTKAHNGELTVETKEGLGTSFIILLTA